LKDRPADLPLLVRHFVSILWKAIGTEDFTFSPEAMEGLQVYDWPGNVRELENVVHSALLMADSSPVSREFLPVSVRDGHIPSVTSPGEEPLAEVVTSNREKIEKKAIIEGLRECRGRRNKTADHLGISRSTLLRKMKKYRIT